MQRQYQRIYDAINSAAVNQGEARRLQSRLRDAEFALSDMRNNIARRYGYPDYNTLARFVARNQLTAAGRNAIFNTRYGRNIRLGLGSGR